MIASGALHSLFIKTDGSLWGMGDNEFGELGDNTFTYTNRPKQIVAGGVIAVAANYHSLFLKSDGSLWAMGDNRYGQLGDGTTNDVNLPEQIVASGVTAIGGGQLYSLFLKSDGSLWAMGKNDLGQLGDGTFNDTHQPEEIIASGVTAIATGGAHSLFLKSDGSLWAMGYNLYGQLGDGTFNNTNLPEQIVASNVTAIAAGAYYSLFLKSGGSLWAMGDNRYGQLGNGTFALLPQSHPGTNQPQQILASNVTAIAAGFGHSLFLKSDGSLWDMGYNNAGQLGDGFSDGSNSLPEQIFPVPQPVLSCALSSLTNLQLKATTALGGNLCLMCSTNIALPVDQWARLRTNSVTVRGTNNYSVTLRNAVTNNQQLYILQSQ
jgi:alpha-tubulin suppressor-like RCC1 family protein